MEKKMVNDVYVIEGIDSTTQLLAFYKEVVEKNIEKYVGITVQGVRFKVDSNEEKAVQLKPTEDYGINPHFRPVVDITPIEQLVEETAEVCDKEEEIIVEAHTEEVEAATVIKEVPETDMSVKLLEEKIQELSKESAFQKERADSAEQQLSLAQLRNTELIAQQETDLQKIAELENEIVQLKDTEQETVCEQVQPETLDDLLEKLHNLGYDTYVKKIW